VSEDPDVAFIGKPFSPKELVSKVRDVLDAG
jgi:DNA-binding response OmpR family regulator